ncbi:MAG: DUF5985 family protein [Xanthobacteraceae bacterium]
MLAYVSGMTTMGYLIAGLFFFRFWWRISDALFIYFGVSFCMLAVSQALATLAGIPGESQSWIYLLRLAAFTLLIVGIIAKNFGEGRRGSGAADH